MYFLVILIFQYKIVKISLQYLGYTLCDYIFSFALIDLIKEHKNDENIYSRNTLLW